MSNKILIFIIFLLALFLRIYNLSSVPVGFHQDEAANAYMGKFIILNGKDFYGNTWPIFYFDKWGDYPPVLPMYFSGLGSLIFGDNVFGARIVIAFFGALTVVSIFYLSLHIFKKESLALISAFFLAIMPWHIVFSRTSAEGILALFFFTTALAYYFSAKNKPKRSTLAFAFFLLSYLSYPSFRLIVPLSYLALVLIDKFEFKKFHKSTVAFTIFFFFLTFWISTTDWGGARLKQTSILNEITKNMDYYNQFIFDDKSILTARVFHNKLVFFVQDFLKQYLNYFSPTYLFMGENANPAWYRYPNSGLIYFYFGLVSFGLILANVKNKQLPLSPVVFIFIIFLLFATPVPAALTYEHAIHMHRSIGMILPLTLLFTIGLYFWIKIFSKHSKIFLGLSFLILAIEFINFTHNYFGHVSVYSSLHRSEANQYAALYIKENKNKYNSVQMFVTGWFPVYYLYHTSNYSKELIGKINKMYFPKIENVLFIPKDCPDQQDIDKLDKNSLILFSSICDPNLYTKVKQIDSIKSISGLGIFNVFVTM
ncbi:MAG: hypothetical protein KatS3mg091_082 [Patescibacteria group bacterium]|nr:MAG: hypothetical protein KatS3mg091_082 [Patescibacteria group bacterium]